MDLEELVDALHLLSKIVGIDHLRHGIEEALVRVGALPLLMLGGGKMRALAIEVVMGGDAQLGAAAAQRRANRQLRFAGAIMFGEARPWRMGNMGALHPWRGFILPYTDFMGIGAVAHGGALGWLEKEGGGEVPVLASSLHMQEVWCVLVCSA